VLAPSSPLQIFRNIEDRDVCIVSAFPKIGDIGIISAGKRGSGAIVEGGDGAGGRRRSQNEGLGSLRI